MGRKQTEKHHVLPKKSQKEALGTVYDDNTIPIEKEMHDKITHQILHEGVPPATTVGEIDLDDFQRARYPRNKEYRKR